MLESIGLVTPGIILFTENFAECVQFYRDRIGLPVWFEKAGLVCLRFGDGYLMVETGGVAGVGPKMVHQNPTVLRFNVDDLAASARFLRGNGVVVALHRFAWGQIGKFSDPDGNLCELRQNNGQFS